MNKKVKVAINGFGRIGRTATRILTGKKDIELVAINDLTDAPTLAHLLKYDTNYGTFSHEVSASSGEIKIGSTAVPVYGEKDPTKLPWEKLEVDVVLECTGHFTDKAGASLHLKAGAKRVIISAPPKDELQTYVIGVNDHSDTTPEVMSNASCTTNSIAPVMAVLQAQFGVKKAMMTTIHSYTADQNLQDGPHKDLRRARAAAENMVPTTTGAAISATEVIPELKNKFDGLAIRVPTPVVSLSDITVVLERAATAETINQAFVRAAKQPHLKGILEVTDQPLVSSDFIGNPASAIVDLSLTKVVDGDLAKVVAWYDNEFGYSNRLIELAEIIGRR